MGILLLITVFIIYHHSRNSLRELHPSDHDSDRVCRSRRSARCSRCTSRDVELGVYGYVGIVMLIGIVEKNAIMMIDFALERQRSENITPTRAIVEAASVRFRPIMMTTVSAIVGTLPIAIGVGTSARVAPSAGYRGGGWSRVLAGRHAVRDAGVLLVLRPAAVVAWVVGLIVR